MMRAIIECVDMGVLCLERFLHVGVEFVDGRFVIIAARDAGLIGDDDHEIAGLVEQAHGLRRAGDPLQLVGLVGHWVKVAGSQFAVGLVAVDAPLVTFGDIDRGAWPEKFEPKSSTVFSWVMNNYWHTDFRRVQTGDYTFRYALTSDRELSPEFLARFGRAAMTPLEIGQLISNDKFGNPEVPLAPAPTSFVRVDAENVVIENWKAAEDGQGTILRLLEVGGRAGALHLEFPQLGLKRAWLADAREENQKEVPAANHSLDLKIQPHEILSVRIIASK